MIQNSNFIKVSNGSNIIISGFSTYCIFTNSLFYIFVWGTLGLLLNLCHICHNHIDPSTSKAANAIFTVLFEFV